MQAFGYKGLVRGIVNSCLDIVLSTGAQSSGEKKKFSSRGRGNRENFKEIGEITEVGRGLVWA